jgi:hypothetical protein
VMRSTTVDAVPEVLDPTDKAVDPVPEATARAAEVEGDSGAGGEGGGAAPEWLRREERRRFWRATRTRLGLRCLDASRIWALLKGRIGTKFGPLRLDAKCKFGAQTLLKPRIWARFWASKHGLEQV